MMDDAQALVKASNGRMVSSAYKRTKKVNDSLMRLMSDLTPLLEDLLWSLPHDHPKREDLRRILDRCRLWAEPDPDEKDPKQLEMNL